MAVTRPAVFVDRDGTLIEDVGYLERVGRVAIYPWTVDAVRALNRAGLPVVVVSNQSGVARGFFSETAVAEIHDHLNEALEAGGARVDAYYYCPHHPEGTVVAYARACECRKPGRGMVDRAAADLDLDPARSFVVGDRWVDIALARAVAARGVLVRTGYGFAEEGQPPAGLAADLVTDNFAAAVAWILGEVRLRAGAAYA